MRKFFEKHKTLVLIIIVLLATALLAGAAVGVLMVWEPWADSEDTASVNTSAPISSAEASSDNTTSPLSSMSNKDMLESLAAMNASTLPDGVYFYEDFYNKLKASDGWNKDASVSGGKYKGGGVVLTDFSAVTSRSDYAVEADITMNMFPETTNQLSVAAILGRYVTSGDTGGGYEVGLAVVNKTGEMYIRVYDRLKKKDVCTFTTINLEGNRTYTFTAVFSGKTLAVFVDGAYAGQTTVENRAGGVGMARSGYNATYDEFRVRKATSAELTAIKNPPQTTVNTSSAEGLPEGVLFYEDFEDDLKTTDGWNANNKVSNGMYSGAAGISLTRHTAISAMKDYAIEAEVMVNPYSECKVSTSVASIIGRITTKKGADDKNVSGGFEVAFTVPTSINAQGEKVPGQPYIRVYDRISGKVVSTFKNVSLYLGQFHKITLVFSGTQLAVFVDDTYVGKVTVEDRSGTVGLSQGGYTAMFDEFTVRKATADELAKLK